MDISKLEKWSPSSNVYDDLHGLHSLSRSKGLPRNTSTIGYISPRQIETPQVKRPTISLILPPPTTVSSVEHTILSVDETNRSNEQENKNQNLVFKKNDQSCMYWTIREIIRLVYVSLFACLMAMFIFTLIFYAFDTYWLEQPIINSSTWWWLDNNDTNRTGFDYTVQTINYDDEY